MPENVLKSLSCYELMTASFNDFWSIFSVHNCFNNRNCRETWRDELQESEEVNDHAPGEPDLERLEKLRLYWWALYIILPVLFLFITLLY